MATQYTIQQAIARAYEIKSHNPYYSMTNRGTTMDAEAYDCSSFVGTVWDVPGRPATPNMVSVYTTNGFTYLKYDVNALKRGDILVWNKPGSSGYGSDGHTAIYLGNNKIIEATANSTAGPNGGVIDTRSPSILAWQDILRSDSGIYITNVTDFY